VFVKQKSAEASGFAPDVCANVSVKKSELEREYARLLSEEQSRIARFEAEKAARDKQARKEANRRRKLQQLKIQKAEAEARMAKAQEARAARLAAAVAAGNS
jgi:hypothetical protein